MSAILQEAGLVACLRQRLPASKYDELIEKLQACRPRDVATLGRVLLTENRIRHLQSLGIGLKNAGANCWMNALFQLFINIPEMKEHFLAHLDEPFTVAATTYKTDQAAGKILSSVDTQQLRLTLASFGISKSSLRQEDALEGFACLATPLDPATNPLFHQMEIHREYANGQSLDERLSQLQFPLPLTGPRDLHTLVYRACHPDRSDHDPALVGGESTRLVKETHRFIGTPENLTFSLQRFTSSLRKITTPIDCPRTLVLEMGDQYVLYDLRGMITHSGSFKGGHYKTYIFNDEITEYNDRSVKPVSATPKDGYLIQYRKKRTLTAVDFHAQCFRIWEEDGCPDQIDYGKITLLKNPHRLR